MTGAMRASRNHSVDDMEQLRVRKWLLQRRGRAKRSSAGKDVAGERIRAHDDQWHLRLQRTNGRYHFEAVRRGI